MKSPTVLALASLLGGAPALRRDAAAAYIRVSTTRATPGGRCVVALFCSDGCRWADAACDGMLNVLAADAACEHACACDIECPPPLPSPSPQTQQQPVDADDAQHREENPTVGAETGTGGPGRWGYEGSARGFYRG